MWWVCITFPVSRALHTDEGEVSRAGRFCAHRRRFTAHASYRIMLLLYSIANNSILFSAVHHAQHAHTVKPRVRPTVGTGLSSLTL